MDEDLFLRKLRWKRESKEEEMPSLRYICLHRIAAILLALKEHNSIAQRTALGKRFDYLSKPFQGLQ
jgi:hypothetical protein